MILFHRVHESPTWKIDLPAAFLGTLFVGSLMVPAAQAPVRRIYEESFGSGGAEAALSAMLKIFIFIHVVFTGFLVIVRWLFFTCAILAMTRVYDEGRLVSWRTMFNLAARAEYVFVIMGVITVMVIYLRGLDAISTEADLTVVKGLDVLYRDNGNENLRAILQGVHVSALAYLAVIGKGIEEVSGISWKMFVPVAIAAWLGWIAVQIVSVAGRSFALDLIARL